MITEEQADKIIEGQKDIIEGINKLLALFILEPVNDTTNPILTLTQAAQLLGVSSSTLKEACRKNEVPYAKMGDRYIFSRVALMAWLHHINTTYLFSRLENYNKHYRDTYLKNQDKAFIENWIRIKINSVSGAEEDFKISFTEEDEESKRLDLDAAAQVLGVPSYKLRDWASSFLYTKIPVIREGKKYFFFEDDLLKWAETSQFKKIRDEFNVNRKILAERNAAAEERREAERLEKEAKRLKRLEKKKNTPKE